MWTVQYRAHVRKKKGARRTLIVFLVTCIDEKKGARWGVWTVRTVHRGRVRKKRGKAHAPLCTVRALFVLSWVVAMS